MKATRKQRLVNGYPICKICKQPIESKPERGALPKYHRNCYFRQYQAKMRKTHKAKDRAYDKLLKEYTDLQYYCQQLQTKVITLQDNAHASR